jgi:hypothetical protein
MPEGEGANEVNPYSIKPSDGEGENETPVFWFILTERFDCDLKP